jgi:hypothetical protein
VNLWQCEYILFNVILDDLRLYDAPRLTVISNVLRDTFWHVFALPSVRSFVGDTIAPVCVISTVLLADRFSAIKIKLNHSEWLNLVMKIW